MGLTGELMEDSGGTAEEFMGNELAMSSIGSLPSARSSSARGFFACCPESGPVSSTEV